MANTLNLGNGNWATKEDSLLAYNSENGNFKPLPFDFTRASSATVVNKAGLIETVGSGEPRIDFRDDANGALLLEPTRSNLVTYSNDFSNASWNNPSTVTANTKISPSGLQNADTVTSTLYKFISATNGLDYTVSAFVKKELSSQFVLRLDLNTPNSCSFDLDTLTAGSGGKIEDYGNNWYRCSFTATATITATGVFYLLITSPSIYIFGAQLEQGSYATSYIPTQGSAVTRVADACNNAGNDQVFNDSEGVLYVEISALANDLTYRSISISGHINLFYNNVSNTIVVSSTGGALIIKQLSDITSFNKIALKYKANDFALWVNGVELGTDTSATTSNSLTTLNYDNGAGGSKWYGSTKQIQYYTTALTDTELQALTT